MSAGETNGGRTAVEVRITGRVQGVWYRGWTRQEAQHLGLAGWVRNLPDGSVAARFEGPAGAVARMVELCRRGPGLAVVAEVEVVPAAPDPDATGFEVRR